MRKKNKSIDKKVRRINKEELLITVKVWKNRILSLWGLIAVISLYVLLSNFIPSIGIPFSILDDNTKAFNETLSALAASYLMGLFVYYLTVYRKNKKHRKKRKWELDYLLIEINRTLMPMETEIGRFEKTDALRLKNECEDTIFDTFTSELHQRLDKASHFIDIMTDEENDIIAEVRRLLEGLINPPSMMDYDEAQRSLQSLKEVRSNVDNLQKSINTLMGRTPPPKPQTKKE